MGRFMFMSFKLMSIVFLLEKLQVLKKKKENTNNIIRSGKE